MKPSRNGRVIGTGVSPGAAANFEAGWEGDKEVNFWDDIELSDAEKLPDVERRDEGDRKPTQLKELIRSRKSNFVIHTYAHHPL